MSDSNSVIRKLPDRNATDIPESVQWFLSVCEVAIAWERYARDHMGEEQDRFCRGVVDYWWDYEDMNEPHFGMIFQKPLDSHDRWKGWPSKREFAYQKGAIVGYKLAEEYKNEY